MTVVWPLSLGAFFPSKLVSYSRTEDSSLLNPYASLPLFPSCAIHSWNADCNLALLIAFLESSEKLFLLFALSFSVLTAALLLGTTTSVATLCFFVLVLPLVSLLQSFSYIFVLAWPIHRSSHFLHYLSMNLFPFCGSNQPCISIF